jgi:hypothetical protein
MNKSYPSALVNGLQVFFRLDGDVHEISQLDLRDLLGLPPGPTGVGITVFDDRFEFEFARDNQTAKITAKQLKRRLIKRRKTAMSQA